MTYQVDGDWRVWKAGLVADVSILANLQRDGMPSLPIAADGLEAMALLAAEWGRVVFEISMTYGGQLQLEAVRQLQSTVRQLGDLSVSLRALSEAIDPRRGDQAG